MQNFERLKIRRWRLENKRKIKNIKEAENFVNELGLLAPFSHKLLPTLYQATYSKSKPRADGWDWDRIDKTWNFAKDLAAQKKAYYGKLISRKNCLISMALFPSFYKLYKKGYYLDEYYDGYLSRTAKQIMDILSNSKPLPTKILRSRVGLRGKEGTREFHNALEILETKAMIARVGSVKSSTGWDAFIWGTLEDWLPQEIKEQAEEISPEEAMTNIIEKFVFALVITDTTTISRFFKWQKELVKECVYNLISEKKISEYTFENKKVLVVL